MLLGTLLIGAVTLSQGSQDFGLGDTQETPAATDDDDDDDEGRLRGDALNRDLPA